MKKFLLLFSSFLTLTIWAQTPKQKIIDRTFIPFNARQSVVLGNRIYTTANNTAANEYYPGIIKQNLELDPLWIDMPYRGTFGAVLDRLQSTPDIIATPTNHLLVAGHNGILGNTDMWMFKLDTLENILWYKDIQTSASQSVYEMYPNNNNGAVISATEFPTSNPSNIQVVNIDGNGDTLWTRKIISDGGSNLVNPRIYMRGNGEVVSIIRNGLNSQFNELDASGNDLGDYEYQDGTGAPIRVSGTYYNGTHAFYVGKLNSTYDSFILKVDNVGNVVWCKSYPEIGSLIQITELQNGDLIAVGGSNTGQFINQVQMIKVDSNGDPLIAKTYGQLPSQHTLGSRIIKVNDKFLVSGERQYQTVSTAYQIMLDSNLNSGSCYEREFQITAVSKTITPAATAGLSVSSLYPDITFYGPHADATYLWGASFTAYNIDNNIDAQIEVVGDDCGGSCNGMASATATGGDPTYTFEWSDGQTGSVASGLCNNDQLVLLTGDQLGCYTYDTLIVPEEAPVTNVCMVTVDQSSTQNVVVWEKPVSNVIDGFAVYREVVGNYTLVGYIPYDSLSQFIDNTNGVNPSITSYRYKIATIDTCGNESDLSDYHETIHLTKNQGTGNTINLIWDNYEGATFAYNRILRDSTGQGNWEVLDSVASNVFTWTDTNPPLDSADYVIEIIFSTVCTATGKAQDYNSSRSNTTTSIEGGIDGFADQSNYSFEVFPNPADDKLIIQHGLKSGEIIVADISGRIHTHQQIINVDKTVLPVDELSTGIYVVTIMNEGVKSSVRFVKN